MPDIKTKDIVQDSIKTINKSAVATERMKSAFIRTKENAEHGLYTAENSPNEYAVDRIQDEVDTVGRKTVRRIDKFGRNGIKATRENISKVKTYFGQNASDIPKEQVWQRAGNSGRRPGGTMKSSIKTVKHGKKNIKQATKSVGKTAIKTSRRSVKAAQKTVKGAQRTIKTAQKTANTAQKTAQATAKAAKIAAQSARAAAKAAASTAKAAVKATIATVKAIIAGIKALVAAIAAGGWVAVLVIVIVCLIALLLRSCFGIFFSGEDSNSEFALQDVVGEINSDYQKQIDTIKTNISYDVLEISDSSVNWPEVLAVYAVKTTTDPSNAQEVVTMDTSKKTILKDIFWQMNQISSRTETKTEEVVTETDDGYGNIVETTTTQTIVYLYITVSNKTVEEMANQYGFNEDQREQLVELLAEENRSMWDTLINISDE